MQNDDYVCTGQPILAAVGFQPALSRKRAVAEGSQGRLKGGFTQDWLPPLADALTIRNSDAPITSGSFKKS
jgi:hypothetical protein